MLNKGKEYGEITQLLSQGRFVEASRAIENARSRLPISVYLECLGNFHFYHRELQDAVVPYEEAMKADPEYDVARYHYIVGVNHEKAGDFVEAFKRYQASIAIEPSFPDAYVELGGLLVKIGDLEGALKCYKHALVIDRDELKNYSNVAEVLKSLAATDPDKYEIAYRHAINDFSVAEKRLPPIEESANW
jgi:tetratricopeptide (TPR) repeat protein